MERQEIKRQNFNSDLLSYFSKLRQDKQFHDVSLYLSPEHIYPAHKILLAFTSSYFSRLFSCVPCPLNTTVTLPQDLTHTQVTYLLDYIYLGQVNLPNTDVNTFLELAACFQLRGLSQDGIVGESGSKKNNVIQVIYYDDMDLIKDITNLDLYAGNSIENKKEHVKRNKSRGSTIADAQSARSSTSRALPKRSSTLRSSSRLVSTRRTFHGPSFSPKPLPPRKVNGVDGNKKKYVFGLSKSRRSTIAPAIRSSTPRALSGRSFAPIPVVLPSSTSRSSGLLLSAPKSFSRSSYISRAFPRPPSNRRPLPGQSTGALPGLSSGHTACIVLSSTVEDEPDCNSDEDSTGYISQSI